MSNYEADETQLLIDLYESDSKTGIKENRLGSSTPPKLSARLDEFTNEAYDDLKDVAKYIDKRIQTLQTSHDRTPLDNVDSQELKMLKNVDHQIDLALERKKIRDDDDCAYFCETGEHRYSYFADVYPCNCESEPLSSEISMPEAEEVVGGNKKRRSNRRRRKQSSKSRKTRKNTRKNTRNTRRKQKAGSKKRVKYNKTKKTRKTRKTKKLRK